MGKKATAAGWRNRVVRLEYHRPDELLDHPKQWKQHGTRQLTLLRAVLGEVGIAGALHAWRSERAGGRLTVWDGHGRKSLDPKQRWPVLVTDLSDEEAAKLLLLFDPIGALADIEPEKLALLVADVGDLDDALRDLVRELAGGARGGAFNPEDLVDSFAEGVGDTVDCVGLTFTFRKEDAAVVRGAVRREGMAPFAARIVALAGAGEGGERA